MSVDHRTSSELQSLGHRWSEIINPLGFFLRSKDDSRKTTDLDYKLDVTELSSLRQSLDTHFGTCRLALCRMMTPDNSIPGSMFDSLMQFIKCLGVPLRIYGDVRFLLLFCG
ncbi:hypothetical protein TNIN_369911 [Trichonephila inaurata madagascariensis]|uniref:Uncharacterized protein n=1 Tax=Trichonephila inaurata madagascariensis TaxID=2747483 RepID=A0A8X6WRF5_9ARAC|nr:hypothetical protein TNIN_369911 [Trichonephila inaurata madagascariensis]